METITLIDGTTAPLTEQNAWFLRPALVEGEVVETATEQELETAAASFMRNYDGRLTNLPHYINPAPLYMARLKQIVSDLTWRAEGAAIGKRGTREYIEGQVKLYLNKRKSVDSENPYVIGLLEGEAAEYAALYGVSMSLQNFKDLIIYRAGAGHEINDMFQVIIERGRTKIQTLIEQENDDAVLAGFDLALSIIDPEAQDGDIDPETTINSAKDILTQILAL